MTPKTLTSLAIPLALAVTSACSGRSSNATTSIGVSECDEYVTKMNACIAKSAQMKAMEPGFRAQQDAWKQMATTNASTVRANCKMALESLTKNPACQ
jgi:hypothetical protein